MTIEAFADKHRLTTIRCAQDFTTIVPGRHGEIYEFSDDELGVLIIPAPEEFRFWGHARKTMVKSGMTIRQNGDHEGAVSFDPRNKSAARLAIKLIGARRKRVASPAQLAALAKARTLISIPTAGPAAV